MLIRFFPRVCGEVCCSVARAPGPPVLPTRVWGGAGVLMRFFPRVCGEVLQRIIAQHGLKVLPTRVWGGGRLLWRSSFTGCSSHACVGRWAGS